MFEDSGDHHCVRTNNPNSLRSDNHDIPNYEMRNVVFYVFLETVEDDV